MANAKKTNLEELNTIEERLEDMPADAYFEPAETSDEDLLHALLSAESVVTKQEYLPRFGYFTIKSITADEYNRLVEQCKYPVKNKRTHQLEYKLNEEKLSLLLIKEACIKPNWSNEQLLEKYGTSDPCVVINKRLLIGEISQLNSAIMDISGFSDDMETVKN